MDRPLRLITASPVDRLARTIEALLVVASQPLSAEELAEAANDDAERVETALRLLAERFAEGRSGIVLEHIAGGWAFRASREAAEACGRLFERPVERGLSAAALETVAIVAYLGPVSRPEIARIRGVAADSVDPALRARVRARLALGTAAAGRSRREHGRDPHAPRVGRRAPPGLNAPLSGDSHCFTANL
jgi:chromosome segregation and condensation protein ScpB